MEKVVDIVVWVEAVKQIGFEKALILILVALLSILITAVIAILWFQGRKIDGVKDAIYCLKRSVDKMLGKQDQILLVEEAKAEARRDPAAEKIKNIVNGSKENPLSAVK